MTWVKLSNGGSITYYNFDNFPGDYWAQADVWIPGSDLSSSCLLGATIPLFGFGFPHDFTVGGYLGIRDITFAFNWRWAILPGVFYTSGPAADTTYTLGFHYHDSTIADWYVDGVLIESVAVDANPGSAVFLGPGVGCCCESYYFTNVKIGTTEGGTDIFADDFSGGLGNWEVPGQNPAGFVSLVAAPADDPCPTLTVTPERGQAGTTMTISGSGFDPDSPLRLYFDLFGVAPVPIEAFDVTADGSGSFTTSIPTPNGVTSEGDTPWNVNVVDDLGNVGCSTFAVCGARKSDGITTLPDPIVATGGGTEGGTVLDYIFHDGAHWVLWQDPSTSAGASTTFPPPANHTLNATRISADGSSVVDYPMDTNYKWNFDGGQDDDPGLGDFRLCGGVSKSSPGWTTNKWFDHWSKPVYDARFASDGTNLWVGVITAETIEYPWLDNKDATQTNPGSAAQFVPLGALTSGFTSFATNSGPGDSYLRHYVSTFGSLSFFAGTAFPTTDAGPQGMGVWSPPVVVMFSFDGAAFNRIGDIPALYCPDTDGDNAYNNANTSIFGTPPHITGVAAQFSRISLAASPSDPGVCHAVWAEGGDWGRVGDGDPCYVNSLTGTNRYTWDGGPANRDYRINYTSWSPTAKLTDTDLWHAHTDRTNLYFFYNQFGTNEPNWIALPDQADYTFSQDHDLRNDNPSGRVFLFLAWPQVFQNISCPDGATNCGGIFVGGGGGFGPSPWAGPDVDGNPWLQNDVALADTIHVYDITGGTVTPLQSITPDLFPTETETDYFYPPVANAAVPPLAPDALYDDNGYTGSYDIDTASVMNKPFGISLVYEDPLLGGTPVYLVSALWTKRWVASATNPGFYFDPHGGFPVLAFHRVPADMSGPFDFLDGDRQVNFTLLNAQTSPGLPMGPGDFFSDPRNIWEPLASLRSFAGSSNWYDRICLNEWAGFSAAWTPDVGPAYAKGPMAPGFHYDPDADSITIVTPDPTFTDLFAVTTQFICRECRDCKCGTGVHLAHRF